MKNFASTLFTWLLAFLILASPFLLGWLTWRWLSGVQPENFGAIIAAIAAVGVTAGTFWGNQRTARKQSVEEYSREAKIDAYKRLNDLFLTKVLLASPDQRAGEGEIIEFFRNETADLMLYASNGVIKKWGAIRTATLSGSGPEGRELLFLWEDFFKEMRKDVGHSSLGLQKGHILRLFVNDIDNI